MNLDVLGTTTGVPHIVVEKIIDVKTDAENGESLFCIKWENTWVPESAMSCMFPDLLAAYKETDRYKQLQNEVENTFAQASSNDRLADALNLMELSNREPIGKSHDSFEVLDLFSTDLEFVNLLRWRENIDTVYKEPSYSKPTKRLAKSPESSGRSKRMRKPTAKKLESDETETNRYLNSPKNKKSRGRRGRGRPGTAASNKRSVNNESVQCDICGKVVRQKRLQTHRILHTNESKYSCETCGKICGTKSDLQNHMLIHGDFNYQCEYCDQKFKQPAPYRIHMKMHTVEMNWMCDICFQNFKYQGELKKHCTEAHADIGKNPQRCCICKEMLKSPNSVYRHSVGHTGVRSFECGVCGKKFKHKGHLEKHLLMHEKAERKKIEPEPEGPFGCEICGKEFQFLQSIKIHLGKHKANQENNLEEYLEKKALRQAASKERYRKNAKMYKVKYKEMQEQKSRILKELGIEPDNPIAKTIDFKSLIKNIEEENTETTTVEEEGVVNRLKNPQEQANVVEVESNIVGDAVVLGGPITPSKAVEYVVTENGSVVVQDGSQVTEINVTDLDSGFALLNFLRQSQKQ